MDESEKPGNLSWVYCWDTSTRNLAEEEALYFCLGPEDQG